WQLEVTLVASGNAPESPVCRSGLGQIPGYDRETHVDAVGGKVKALSWPGEGVESRSPVVRVHGPHGLPLVHADPVETSHPGAAPAGPERPSMTGGLFGLGGVYLNVDS